MRNPNEAEVYTEDKIKGSALEEDSNRINKSGAAVTDKDFFENNPLKTYDGLALYGGAKNIKQTLAHASTDVG